MASLKSFNSDLFFVSIYDLLCPNAIDEFCHNACPARLMRSSDAAGVVTMKIFVEQNEVGKMRIIPVNGFVSVEWSFAFFILFKYFNQPFPNFICNRM